MWYLKCIYIYIYKFLFTHTHTYLHGLPRTCPHPFPSWHCFCRPTILRVPPLTEHAPLELPYSESLNWVSLHHDRRLNSKVAELWLISCDTKIVLSCDHTLDCCQMLWLNKWLTTTCRFYIWLLRWAVVDFNVWYMCFMTIDCMFVASHTLEFEMRCISWLEKGPPKLPKVKQFARYLEATTADVDIDPCQSSPKSWRLLTPRVLVASRLVPFSTGGATAMTRTEAEADDFRTPCDKAPRYYLEAVRLLSSLSYS